VTDFHIVIPARLGASRLPDKPLVEIAGRPLVVHAWANAVKAGAAEVIVAADDARICEVVERAGGRAMMTSPTHASGTDRLAEVATTRGWPDDAVVVNLQGDEPMIPGALLGDLADALSAHGEAGIATMATPIRDAEDVGKPSVVKVVIDRHGYALYFSRAPIPFDRDGVGDVPRLRHLGLYAYRVGTLRALHAAPRGAYERAESLEQLRALELGIRIHVTVVDEAPPHGVDTEEDLERVRRALA
jgi:3-deoxy-manno-octulosonate cytidylyltransferase (CMP-KDO synthetase)